MNGVGLRQYGHGIPRLLIKTSGSPRESGSHRQQVTAIQELIHHPDVVHFEKMGLVLRLLFELEALSRGLVSAVKARQNDGRYLPREILPLGIFPPLLPIPILGALHPPMKKQVKHHPRSEVNHRLLRTHHMGAFKRPRVVYLQPANACFRRGTNLRHQLKSGRFYLQVKNQIKRIAMHLGPPPTNILSIMRNRLPTFLLSQKPTTPR